jgi:hypothetical protein
MHFILEGVTTERLKDSRGNTVWTVFAKPASERDQTGTLTWARHHCDDVLGLRAKRLRGQGIPLNK